MSTTVVAPGGLEVSSNHESADVMLASLATEKPEARAPRVIVKGGKPVKDEGETDETSQAASVLGKKGGEAAAEARKLKAKSGAKDPKGASVDLDEAALKDAKDRAAEKDTKTAAAGKDDDPEPAEAKDKKAGNPRHDPEARIAEVVRARREAEDRARAAEDRARRTEERLAALERERTAPAPAAGDPKRPAAARAAEAAPDDDPEPQEADYENYADYVKDAGRHAARQEFRKQEQARARTQQEDEHGRRIMGAIDAFTERIQKAAEEDESFIERTADIARQLQPSFTLAPGQRPGAIHVLSNRIMKSEHSAALMLHLADNPDEFQRLAALRTRDDVVSEVAKLEGRLTAVTADTSVGREVSRAGSPVRSVAGSPHVAEPDLSQLPFEEHLRRKRAKA